MLEWRTTMKKQTIGQRIKELRASKQMSQAELGDKLGASNKTISKWENDLSEPGSDTLKAIAGLFNVTINYLISGEESKIEGYTMTAFEAACKYDDITLLKDVDLTLPDANGKDIFHYAYKSFPPKVLNYLRNCGIEPKDKKERIYEGLIILTGKKWGSNPRRLLAASKDKKFIDSRIDKYSREYYKDLRTYRQLSSNSECKFDFDRMLFNVLSDEGKAISLFKISMLDDYESGLLEVKDLTTKKRYMEYIEPSIYKEFLKRLDECNFKDWKGRNYGVPFYNTLISLKSAIPLIRNRNYVNPPEAEYKKFLAALTTLILETIPSTEKYNEILKLINYDTDPYHIEGLSLDKSSAILSYIETTDPDANIEMDFFYEEY